MAAEDPEAVKEEASQKAPESGEPVTDAAAVPAEEAAPLAPIIVKKIIRRSCRCTRWGLENRASRYDDGNDGVLFAHVAAGGCQR